jgi:hypothetical protein
MSKLITIIGGGPIFMQKCTQKLLKYSNSIKILSITNHVPLNLIHKFDERVEFVLADTFDPESFDSHLEKSQAIIYYFGKLDLSYDYDLIDDFYFHRYKHLSLKIAEICHNDKKAKNFVFVSPTINILHRKFQFNYFKSKTEKIILEKYEVGSVIIQPGNISYRETHQPGSEEKSTVPSYIEKVDRGIYESNNKTKTRILNIKFLPIDILTSYACAGVLGKLPEKIYTQDKMRDLNNLRKINF